jgi:hypothetical protein
MLFDGILTPSSIVTILTRILRHRYKDYTLKLQNLQEKSDINACLSLNNQMFDNISHLLILKDIAI